MTSKKKSQLNFDKTIAGFNVTENGIQSYSKSFGIGPLQFTLNANGEGLRGSISLPGTGLSRRNIKLLWTQGNRQVETDVTPPGTPEGVPGTSLYL